MNGTGDVDDGARHVTPTADDASEEERSELDPGVRALLAHAAATATDMRSWHELSVDELRTRCRTEIGLTSGTGDPSVTAHDLEVPAGGRQIPIRV